MEIKERKFILVIIWKMFKIKILYLISEIYFILLFVSFISIITWLGIYSICLSCILSMLNSHITFCQYLSWWEESWIIILLVTLISFCSIQKIDWSIKKSITNTYLNSHSELTAVNMLYYLLFFNKTNHYKVNIIFVLLPLKDNSYHEFQV